MAKLPKVTIYTDGGCRPNPGPGGWGAVLLHAGRKPRELKGGEEKTTNNRMELQAAIEALRSLKKAHQIELYTDSKYLRQGVSEWLTGWQRNGWRTAGKTAVKNQDLWQELAGEIERHRVAWHWTRGHAGNKWNERADRLASSMIDREKVPVEDPEAVHLFAAAAFSGKKKRGGWAVVLRYQDNEKALSGFAGGATANRMHIEAAAAGLRELKRRVRVHIYTASDYLKDGATSWISGWRARGWQTREGKPVSNRRQWEELAQLLERHEVHWHVVPSREAPEEMDCAKKLAGEAIHGTD